MCTLHKTKNSKLIICKVMHIRGSFNLHFAHKIINIFQMRISQFKFNSEYFDSCRTTMTYPKSCLKINSLNWFLLYTILIVNNHPVLYFPDRIMAYWDRLWFFSIKNLITKHRSKSFCPWLIGFIVFIKNYFPDRDIHIESLSYYENHALIKINKICGFAWVVWLDHETDNGLLKSDDRVSSSFP